MVRVAALLAIAIPVALLSRSAASEQAHSAQQYTDVYYLPPAGWLEVLALGHDEALADLIWCRALVYLGEEYAERGDLTFVFDYTEAMLRLDPDFLAVYRWVATAGVYRPTEVPVADIERTIEFLERGRARFPRDGQLAWLTGATLSFELAPRLPAGAARDDARFRGAEHLMVAQRLGEGPDWLVLSTTSQLAQLGHAERAVEALEEMYATVDDEHIRMRIAERIAEVRDEAYGSAFTEANDALEVRRLRELPYVSPAFYFLVGTDPSESRIETLRDGYGSVTLGPDIPIDTQ